MSDKVKVKLPSHKYNALALAVEHGWKKATAGVSLEESLKTIWDNFEMVDKLPPEEPQSPINAEIAKQLGYEGDACNECKHFTLVRNGTCLKCNNCGATTGCS